MQPSSQLNPTPIDQVFACLQVRYGSEWLRMWEGLDLAAVKADWSRELARFKPRDVAYALEHLPPDRPPTVGQFRAICQRAPIADEPRLPPPKPNKARAREALSKLKLGGQADALAWARDLEGREKAGEQLTPAQREAWRAALFDGPALSVAQLGEFNPIPPEALPPAMRCAA